MNEFSSALCGSLQKWNISVDPQALEKILLYYNLITQKNKVMNLTAITDPRDAAIKHFADSASLLKYFDLASSRIIDIGTGLGIPGIALKLFVPSLRLTLLDSRKKRVDFLNEVIEKLSLAHTTAVCARAEELAHNPGHREAYDFALSRALASLDITTEVSAGFVRPGGQVIAMRGSEYKAELSESGKSYQSFGLASPITTEYTIPDTDILHCLVSFNKTSATHSKFPRSFTAMSRKNNHTFPGSN